MPGNIIGERFVVASFGESHGRCVGVLVDGCPPGIELTEADVQVELDRRRPGQSLVTTTRAEEDRVEILSGVFQGKTTGAPILMLVWNKDVDSRPYEMLRNTPRPGHADYPAYIKYRGFNDYRGGGRFSGRITAGYVMAGAVAKKLLSKLGVEVLAYSLEIGGVKARQLSVDEIRRNRYANEVRCPDFEAAERMKQVVLEARKQGDSVGGIVECIALNLPIGLGEPVFDNLDSDLAKALFSIPAVKGVEFGRGFEAARLRGSENNDPFILVDGKIRTASNNSGGILGGLSTGEQLVTRVAFKPASSIARPQKTVDIVEKKETEIVVPGRHDPTVVPRAVPVVEAVVAFVLADHVLRMGLIQ
ncbi:chorismate synthase [Candidatus Caldarchaeum subterraneum]|uniref:Chorismate synthase n=1 Tax=Caldiarchaeum subterraneum TaxID=311458 RepID=E6N894_CALS0|nr:chorismate synthase [Candidatus Caldarchaeum subterraneum]BAJ51267.1 chorismate synthase [Candidatus Caldarchaeum subterraneum]